MQISDHVSFRKQLTQAINLEELQTLCFDLKVDFDLLNGQNKEGKVRELILLLERDRRTDDLLEACEKLRPSLNWRNGVVATKLVKQHIPSLEIKRQLNDYKIAFSNGKHSLSTIADILLAMRHLGRCSNAHILNLLDIPISVLRNDVTLTDSSAWAVENAHYFSSNIHPDLVTGAKHPYLEVVKNRLDQCNRTGQGNFCLYDVADLTEYTQSQYSDLDPFHRDLLLRIPAKTVMADVELFPHSTFKESGPLFANCVQNAIDSLT